MSGWILNSDQIGGLIRAATPLAVLLGAHFGIGDQQVTLVATTLSTLITAAWSLQTNKSGTVIK